MRKKDIFSLVGFLACGAVFTVLRLPGALDKILVSNGHKDAVCVFRSNVFGRAASTQLIVPENGEMIVAGYPEDINMGRYYPSAYWSQDKRLVVTTSDNSLYLAYDFDNKQTVQGFKEITALLKKHGGSGETIFESKDDFEAKCHHPWLWELHYLNYR